MINWHQQLGQALTPRLRRRGFSLLELSVVLGIISLIAGAGMSMASGALKTADRIATQEKLATIKLALDSHARIYGYLPCAADRALAPTSASFGMEKRTAPSVNCLATVGTSYINASNLIIGAVPVRSLGLPDSYASDSWGNKFTYTVSQVVTANPTSYSTGGGHIVVKYKGSGSNYTLSTQRTSKSYSSVADSGGLINLTTAAHGLTLPANSTTIIHVAGTGTTKYKGSYLISSIPDNTHLVLAGTTYSADDSGTIEWQDAGTTGGYTVVSHGPDGLGAFPTEAATVLKACAGGQTLNVENCDDDADFFDADYNDGAVDAQYFDDFIVWGSSSLARAAVNDQVYTSATTSTCPTGVCEPWCAACTKNYPGGGAALPVTTTSGAVTNPILCKKVLSSSATTCTATCFWGGTNLDGQGTAVSGYQKCP